MADEIVGSDVANILIGGAGNDTINGLGGNNRLEGGADNEHTYFRKWKQLS